VKATHGDPVRQSQYSRQIKELEDFFRVKLVEREGSGTRLTASGKELVRLSRFFLLGLSNFRRGCLEEEQIFRVGASATFIQKFLVPSLAAEAGNGTRYVFEVARGDEIERRLHELTLDFGVTTHSEISRPLQMREIGGWKVKLCVPRKLFDHPRGARRAFNVKKLPLILPMAELDNETTEALKAYEPRLICESFLTARVAAEREQLAVVLPDFLISGAKAKRFLQIEISPQRAHVCHFRLAWNPRLVRLNPHVGRTVEFLGKVLGDEMKKVTRFKKFEKAVGPHAA
jgi:DNA-binding transcriptional LysR family regulator